MADGAAAGAAPRQPTGPARGRPPLRWPAVATYAAYGTNMAPDRMAERAPHSPLLRTGWLQGWRLTFGGEELGVDGALSTIVEEPGSTVFVVLYEVNESDEHLLDAWEGVELGAYRKIRVRKDPECPLCGKNPTITGLIDYEAFCGVVSEEAQEAAAGSTILATELKAKMDRGDDFLLVDVREPAEYEIVSIPGAVLIPKGDFLNGSALGGLPADKQVVLHCKSGARSAEVLAVLKGAGFGDAVHVGGGVSAWVNQIDPSQPTY